MNQDKINETEKGKIAFKAIKKIKDTLDILENKIKHGEHITFEWYAEYDAENDLYTALKNYEELLRKNEKKREDDPEVTIKELNELSPK